MDQQQLSNALGRLLSPDRVKTRLIDLVAYAADAGFYYLRPQAVVLPVNEEEVRALFRFSHQSKMPLCFRAAGTSLSGQSVTDGILVDLSRYWKQIKVEEKGRQVRVEPGVIGAMVNIQLRKWSRKIGPDPASINSAMMGGILSNNASGMCCGVAHNSYHTCRYIRFILPNGACFSTEEKGDYQRFERECPAIYQGLLAMRQQLLDHPGLQDRIRSKYRIKNTVGYSLNALIDYQHPLDMLAHLLIGAEGTLAFIAEAVLDTLPDYPVKATGMLYFPDIYAAAAAIPIIVEAGAQAAELMDRASLRSVEQMEGMPAFLATLPAGAAALLVEFQGDEKEKLETQLRSFLEQCKGQSLLKPAEFSFDQTKQALLWKIRKGLFPSVGAVRKSGTTVILEDIAFPIKSLADAIVDLQALFVKHGYTNAIIFGHARDGNIHFVVTQDFAGEAEVERYDRFLRDVVELVVNKYDGSLKAEHGTGRNMAPFVETEWGPELYQLMKALKQLIDPEQLLNPGVIINAAADAHIRHLKQMPGVEEEVDKCIECGFCEHKCPSRDLTLTPRTRIAVRRELKKLELRGDKILHKQLLREYQYDGLDTCAVDGMCATACPVDINTGALVKRLRREQHHAGARSRALWVARHMLLMEDGLRLALQVASGINRLTGSRGMRFITRSMRRLLPSIPLWSNQLHPSPARKNYMGSAIQGASMSAYIYLPSCLNRVMGGNGKQGQSVPESFMRVAGKLGIALVVPEEIGGSCCGQAFASKGYYDAYRMTANATVEKLWRWSKEGLLPVVMDISSCTQTMREYLPVLSEENKERFQKITIMDSVDFIHDVMMPLMPSGRKKDKLTLHPVCSLYKMKNDHKFRAIAEQLGKQVDCPAHAGCCGMAGDRGFLFPELTASAIRREAQELGREAGTGYYASSKTCEMALSDVAGVQYEGIIYLLDELLAEG